MKTPRLPNNSQRITIVGRTGSGKTVAACWHLSNFIRTSKNPWVVFNFKNEQHIDDMPNVRHIGFDYLPNNKDTGIFVLNPTPQDAQGTAKEPSEVEKYLWKLWARENIGIFVDEGYMMANSDALNACLTQGRSKRIPMIICSQRPVWLSRFAFSEADFYQVFHLNDKRDKQTIEAFVPLDYSQEEMLEDHQSWYFDVGKNKLWKFNPVPPIEEIHFVVDAATKRKRWFL